jgi:hypothetical protein
MGLGRFVRRRKGTTDDTGPLVITITGGLPRSDPDYETASAQVFKTAEGGRVTTITGGLPDWRHLAETRARARAEYEAQMAAGTHMSQQTDMSPTDVTGEPT